MTNERLKQTLFGVTFSNPVLTASGTFGFGEEYTDFYDVSELGGFVTKAVTPEPRQGNPGPRIIETPSGMLNAIGLQNPGLDVFTKEILPRIADVDTNIIVNVAGRTADDYITVCTELDRYDAVRALEINISCPNVKEGGIAFGAQPETAASLVSRLRKATSKPLIVKLSPNVTDISAVAEAVESNGADAISLINTITGMVVNVNTRRPMLANVTGGLSGPAVRPVAVRMVHQVSRSVSIPVIGMGGIISARDALEFIIAGASLVEVGCGMFVEPRLPLEVISGIDDYLQSNSMDNISSLVGCLQITE